MTRAVKEWIGKTDNARIPPRVRLRIWERGNGHCHICKQQIQAGEKWEADHIKALVNGGEHREANLAPAHVKCHAGKTVQDVAEKSKVATKRKKHLGITTPKQKIAGRGFGISEHKAKREKRNTVSLPPRQLFAARQKEME